MPGQREYASYQTTSPMLERPEPARIEECRAIDPGKYAHPPRKVDCRVVTVGSLVHKYIHQAVRVDSQVEAADCRVARVDSQDEMVGSLVHRYIQAARVDSMGQNHVRVGTGDSLVVRADLLVQSHVQAGTGDSLARNRKSAHKHRAKRVG